MRDDVEGVTTPTELLESHQKGQTKTHIVLDAQDRPQFIFTASLDVKDEGPCMVTEYVYLNPTSAIAVSQQERVYKWKSVWETGFIFDPAVDYDLDGDGVL